MVDISVINPGGGLREPNQQLNSLAQTVKLHSRPFIDGCFADSDGGEVVKNITPISGRTLNEIQFATERDVDRAVASARAAFQSGVWSRLAPGDRKRAMLAFHQKVAEHADELAMLDALDVGKPFGAARDVDIAEVLTSLSWYGEVIDKVYGQVAPTATIDLIVREPLGVVAAVVPWNYPLMIAGWKLAPILAAGNSVILKPAEQSPLSALRLAELANEAGIPNGVFNVLPGGGRVGEALGRHPDVDGVAFTGSTTVGKKFLAYAGASTIKAISLECGGKSPAIVCHDADIQAAAAAIAGGVFYNAGQSCNAPTRALVDARVVDEFIAALEHEIPKYQPDNALADGVGVGSIVSEEQLSVVDGYVKSGVDAGAELVAGGNRRYEGSGGFFYEPTILAHATRTMKISCEEIFGPVLPVETFTDLSEAVESGNATPYGLWGSIWTDSVEQSFYVARNLRCGTVAVNNAFGGDITTPMGGMKQSGTGRDRSLEALYKYTHVKHIHVNV